MKLPTFFFKFQTEERVRRVNKSEITGEKFFSGDHFEIGDNHESRKDEKFLFRQFLHICDQSFNI